MSTLTARELQVIELTALGKSNVEIGASLNLSPKTIKNYMARIFEKTETTSRTDVARWFYMQAIRELEAENADLRRALKRRASGVAA